MTDTIHLSVVKAVNCLQSMPLLPELRSFLRMAAVVGAIISTSESSGSFVDCRLELRWETPVVFHMGHILMGEFVVFVGRETEIIVWDDGDETCFWHCLGFFGMGDECRSACGRCDGSCAKVWLVCREKIVRCTGSRQLLLGTHWRP